ncbi:MAG: segregation/condensation protein A [Syntrophales bacterium]|nr:segregation/condensation protein A [Syntrophales bacterium]
MTMQYEVKLPVFEGPLDLLLYLIKKNELDIYHIPIAEITDQYLRYVEFMRTLNLDLAGEYLVLAATLLHIKSRLLLPRSEDEEDDTEDPRAELVEQLVTYQAFREAAKALDRRPQLEREVFTRGSGDVRVDEGQKSVGEWEEIGLFELIDAFQRVLKRMKPQQILEIEGEQLSLVQIISELKEKIQRAGRLMFQELFEDQKSRKRIIYTFLAVLEMVRRKMISIYQLSPLSSIYLFYEGDGIDVNE